MALPATDTFNNGGVTQDLTTYSASWTAQQQMLRVIANTVETPANGQDAVAYWNADSFGNDHYSQAVATVVANYNGIVVRAKGLGSNSNCEGYIWLWTLGAFYKIEHSAGSFTQLATGWTVPLGGSTCKLVAAGTTFTGYINGTQAGTKVDTTYPTGGAPGIYTAGNLSTAQLDTWQGDNGDGTGGGGGGLLDTLMPAIVM